MKTFGERLRELRRENHMTGDELGKKFNVTKTAISYWENGKSFPDEETINCPIFVTMILGQKKKE